MEQTDLRTRRTPARLVFADPDGAYPYAYRRDPAYPVLVSGQRAYKTIRGMSDDAGADALDEHMDRAEKTIGAFSLGLSISWQFWPLLVFWSQPAIRFPSQSPGLGSQQPHQPGLGGGQKESRHDDQRVPGRHAGVQNSHLF
jgi:hypothetical protein